MSDQKRTGSSPDKPDDDPAPEPLRPLTLGQARRSPVPAPGRPPSSRGSEDDELDGLASRCRAKAEAARWAAERQRRLRERDEHADDDAPSDPAIRAWADRLTDAFYWASMSQPTGSPDLTALDHVGGAFETLAEALRLLRAVRGRPGAIEKALPMAAEAQSAVRQALRRLEAPEDPDQLEAYDAVRQSAARYRVFLARFLRADDLADPAAWPELLGRIEAQTGEGAAASRHGPLLDLLCSRLDALGRGVDPEASWQGFIEAVDQAIAQGMPPSSREVRTLLLPHLDDLPDGLDLPTGFQLVLREIDRFLATRPHPTGPSTTQPATAEVAEAARLLSGRALVLIGGLRRPEAQESLRTALGLSELVWIATREHQSIRGFEAAIARPEVAAVLLAIRWSSHAFGEVRQFCERHGKPLVRLPGGYGPNQVAAQILAQCGDRLAGG